MGARRPATCVVRLLPIIDFESFFSGSTLSIPASSAALVLDARWPVCGLLIDELLAMQHFPLAFQYRIAAYLRKL